jgi:anti-sigma regulatory factor (Ser/Thr protein kinase)
MRYSGRQLQRILDDVLDLSRIESGRLTLAERPFELTSLLEHVIELHAPNAAASGLALRLRIDSDLPVVGLGDPDRLAQVLGNLLSNAIKFTDRGAVEVAARLAPDGALVLSVADTGPGIAPEREAELFEPFTQLECATTRRHGGTGLGLAICRRLVEAMGGSLGLHSVPGRGCRFSIRLPQSPAPPPARFRTALLEGMVVASALPAADARVALRLCRRWGLGHARVGRGGDAARSDVLVYREACIAADALAGLRSRGVACVHLGSGGRAGPCVAEPLTESRLLGALLDLRIRPASS